MIVDSEKCSLAKFSLVQHRQSCSAVAREQIMQ
jgi:hypothetical protein